MVIDLRAVIVVVILVSAGCGSTPPSTPSTPSSSSPAGTTRAPAAPPHSHETHSHDGHAAAHSPATSASAPTGGAAAPTTSAAASEEQLAYARARPAFDRSCAGCHTTSGTHAKKNSALKHFSMDSYPFGGHHADEITATIRKVLGATGKRATMPPTGAPALPPEDRAVILAWADAVDAATRPPASGDRKHTH